MTKKSSNIEKTTKLVSKDFRPKTENQKNYIINMSQNDITMCIGVPGSGKSYLSTGLGCQYLSEQKVDKLIFVRPIVGCGKGIGFLPGELWPKIQPYFRNIIDYIIHFIGYDSYKTLLQNNTIEFHPLELMRGMSIKNTFLVLDEANNADLSQLKMLLSRFDYGSKFILEGDYKQTDLKYCDFKSVVNNLKQKNINGLGFCELTEQDNQRPKIVTGIAKSLEEIV